MGNNDVKIPFPETPKDSKNTGKKEEMKENQQKQSKNDGAYTAAREKRSGNPYF